jgi:hypothetical protein
MIYYCSIKIRDKLYYIGSHYVSYSFQNYINPYYFTQDTEKAKAITSEDKIIIEKKLKHMKKSSAIEEYSFNKQIN